ncbi:MAG: hypothetical protein ICV67_02095 [Thermoleophilia bacterium]|nr:hypothetical protein [Thermoleophilia bacterium]
MDYLAAHDDEAVPGAVLIAGDATDAFVRGGCAPGRVPIWAFHGERDDLVPVSRISESIADLEACSDPPPVDVRLTIYPDAGHDSWSRTYDLSAGHDVYAWLLEHRR